LELQSAEVAWHGGEGGGQLSDLSGSRGHARNTGNKWKQIDYQDENNATKASGFDQQMHEQTCRG